MFGPLPWWPLAIHREERKNKANSHFISWLACGMKSVPFSFPSRLIAMKQWDSNSGVGLKEMGWGSRERRKNGTPRPRLEMELTHGRAYPPPRACLALALFSLCQLPLVCLEDPEEGLAHFLIEDALTITGMWKEDDKEQKGQERRNYYLFPLRESSQYDTGRFFSLNFLSSLNESSIFRNCEPLS